MDCTRLMARLCSSFFKFIHICARHSFSTVSETRLQMFHRSASVFPPVSELVTRKVETAVAFLADVIPVRRACVFASYGSDGARLSCDLKNGPFSRCKNQS